MNENDDNDDSSIDSSGELACDRYRDWLSSKDHGELDIDRGVRWPEKYFYCLNENSTPAVDIVEDAVYFFVHSYYYNFSPDLTIQEWRNIGSMISHCKKLKVIHIVQLQGGLTEDILKALFRAEGPYDFPIEHLNLTNNEITSAGMEVLVPYLQSRSELKCLHLGGNNIGDEGARLLADVLDKVRVRSLNICSNRISAVTMSRILSSVHSKSLVHLDLLGNSSGRNAMNKVAQFLDGVGGSLESIRIGDDGEQVEDEVDLECIKILLQALKYNTTLKKLHIYTNRRNLDVSNLSFESFLQTGMTLLELVCDESSFDASCKSNNVLASMRIKSKQGNNFGKFLKTEQVNQAFRINARTDISKNQKLRLKLLTIYFRSGSEYLISDNDMQSFRNMRLVWMPHLLELFTEAREINSEANGRSCKKCAAQIRGTMSCVYDCVRYWNVPELISYLHPQSELNRLKMDVKALQSQSYLKMRQLE
ncbi:hypothetical protein ACHAXS_004268 [Conticribra weissflogii]